ncbi:MAG: hypothetical protein JRN33_05985 [Nitrososphaerota archaeon]|nr:hypothetical protein [Nitrososphaerota archaeon]
MTRSVRQFYSGNVQKEWARLESNPYYRLEFDTTMEYLRRYLPKKGLILDAGGGPAGTQLNWPGRATTWSYSTTRLRTSGMPKGGSRERDLGG